MLFANEMEPGMRDGASSLPPLCLRATGCERAMPKRPAPPKPNVTVYASHAAALAAVTSSTIVAAIIETRL